MGRYTGPKCKLFRREGINIFEPNTSKFKAITKKGYPPGIHGKNSFSKPSEYGKQLREKQKAKRIYGIRETQFKNYYKKAIKTKDITGDALLKLCERRLDNVIFRSGIAKTRPQARQMATHGMFLLNGKRVDVPSLLVKKSDVIEARPRSKAFKMFMEVGKTKHIAPKWLKSDFKNIKIEVVTDPNKEDLEKAIDTQLIVEFYSK